MPSDKSIETLFLFEMSSFVGHLRGNMDIGEYKRHFLAMFFFKYISDQCKEEYGETQEHLQHHPEISETTNAALRHTRFVIPDNKGFDYIVEKRNDPNIGGVINEVLANISRANSELHEIFFDVDFQDERVLGKPEGRPYFLRSLIDLLDGFNFASAKNNDYHIQNIWTILLENFYNREKRAGSTYFTPSAICDLLAKLMQPKTGETIYDPACGSGNLLIRLFKETGEKGDEGNVLFGQEIDSDTSVIARMNMFIHKLDEATIESRDSINRPMLAQENGILSLKKFDIVVSNPPFSVSNWWKGGEDEFERFKWGMPPESKGDYAFIMHMLASAEENKGRIGMITSHGTLFRKGSELKLRKKIIDHNLLEAVIGLPTNLFSYTNIPTAILIFNKGRINGNNSNILFIDASREFEQDKRKNILSDENIKHIVATYEAFKANPSTASQAVKQRYSYIATHEEIENNDYNINIARYITSEEEKQEVDINQLKSEIEILDKKLADINNKMQKHLRNFGL